jgi:WD40 repeat protein
VAALAFDPTSSLLASGSFDTTLRVWKFNQSDATTARRLRQEGHVR